MVKLWPRKYWPDIRIIQNLDGLHYTYFLPVQWCHNQHNLSAVKMQLWIRCTTIFLLICERHSPLVNHSGCSWRSGATEQWSAYPSSAPWSDLRHTTQPAFGIHIEKINYLIAAIEIGPSNFCVIILFLLVYWYRSTFCFVFSLGLKKL